MTSSISPFSFVPLLFFSFNSCRFLDGFAFFLLSLLTLCLLLYFPYYSYGLFKECCLPCCISLYIIIFFFSHLVTLVFHSSFDCMFIHYFLFSILFRLVCCLEVYGFCLYLHVFSFLYTLSMQLSPFDNLTHSLWYFRKVRDRVIRLLLRCHS